MSKTKQQSRRSRRNTPSSDITLNDFANSSVSSGRGRIKKNAVKNITMDVKLLNIEENEQAWDEKLNEDLEPELGEVQVKKSSSRRKRKGLVSECEGEGVDYPVVVWFLISEFIPPEDVGSFAAICPTTYSVVNTAKFWFTLYRRYYRNVEKVPEVLQPEAMVRRYGLRALVIRSLYLTYPPFSNKLLARVESDPHDLVQRRCVVSWSQRLKQENQWLYSFKLKWISGSSFGRGAQSSPKPDLLDMLDDINANVDDNCKVLQVIASNYCPLPMVTGQMLTSVTVKVSQELRYHCVHLQFRSGPTAYLSCTVTVDCVHNLRVLDWWHPAFPHGDRFDQDLYCRSNPLCDLL